MKTTKVVTPALDGNLIEVPVAEFSSRSKVYGGWVIHAVRELSKVTFTPACDRKLLLSYGRELRDKVRHPPETSVTCKTCIAFLKRHAPEMIDA